MLNKADLPAQDKERQGLCSTWTTPGTTCPRRRVTQMESKEPILLGSLNLFHSLIQMEGKEPSRHIKPLEWEQSKLHSIKAVLDATQNARMSKR